MADCALLNMFRTGHPLPVSLVQLVFKDQHMSPVVDLSGGTATKCDVLWVDQLAKAQQVLAHFHLDPALPTPHSNAVVSLWLPQFKVDRGRLHRIHWIFWKPPGQRVVHRLHLLSPEHGSLSSRLPGGPSLRRCCCSRLNFNSQTDKQTELLRRARLPDRSEPVEHSRPLQRVPAHNLASLHLAVASLQRHLATSPLQENSENFDEPTERSRVSQGEEQQAVD
ncbi:hypothetical protein EYF80_023725 [Liparis tanakae]|uniref:Uncharacterized protein n=1 Tax=Liparis tanakae TaxID=230148 RepID=A0A4Z2HJZ2_9TELE|nr:hypothetical protein EYF80_023725 [Liparis tanakae]